MLPLIVIPIAMMWASFLVIKTFMSSPVNCIGNTLWIVFGGFFSSGYYYLLGVLSCCTVIGIPVGRQLFKIGSMSALPFGLTLERRAPPGLSIVLGNILWCVLFGWELFMFHAAAAVASAITIIGIPFAVQHAKLATVCLFPFGVEVVRVGRTASQGTNTAESNIMHHE